MERDKAYEALSQTWMLPGGLGGERAGLGAGAPGAPGWPAGSGTTAAGLGGQEGNVVPRVLQVGRSVEKGVEVRDSASN